MDQDLEKMLKANDPRTERLLFETFYESVYKLVFFMMHDHDAADEVVQETFLKAFRRLHQLKETDKLEAWLRTIARRTALDHLRREKKRNEQAAKEVYLERVESADKLAEDYLQQEAVMAVLTAVKTLHSDHREVLLLKLVDEYSDEEIASELGLNIGTVKSRIHRAKATLKKRLLKGGGWDETE